MASSGVNKVLVITGASKGIGFATAKKFQTEGYSVVNISRTPIDLAGSTQIVADLFDPNWADGASEALRASVEDAEQVAVVHNAAIQNHDSALSLEADQLRKIIELNLIAPTIINRLLAGRLPAKSSIIYIGSTLSLKSIPNMASYATTKHALVGLMRSTCQDLAGTGLHTACVCPGFTKTEMLESYGEETMSLLAQRSTQSRLVEPREIANTVYFCAENSVVNGAVLRADSGLIEI